MASFSASASDSVSAPTPTDPLLSSRFYSFPATWTLQPNLSTRHSQLQRWSRLIRRYCQHHRLWRLTLIDALDTPLFHNSGLRKRLTLVEARAVLDWMSREEGDRRVEWVGGDRERDKSGTCWVYWRRPEEWAEVIAGWVEETGQKGVVLTLYELTEGEATAMQDFYGMDPELLQKTLAVLVKRGKAQVFGSEDQQGVKFF